MSSHRQVDRLDTDRFLATHPVFTIVQLREAMGQPSNSAVRSWLRFHASRGRLRMVERGLYVAVPPEADVDHFAPDALLVARAARPDAVFSGHAALQLLGTAHSVARIVSVFTGRRRRPVQAGNVRIEFRPHPTPLVLDSQELLGVREVHYRGTPLQVTGPERTLLDGFRSPEVVGGLEELVESASGFPSLDLILLDRLLRAYGERVLWAAAGWFLERNQEPFHVSGEYLRTLERHRPASPQYLPRWRRGMGGRLVRRWNLILPEALVGEGGFGDV